jgi:hypothetical protein
MRGIIRSMIRRSGQELSAAQASSPSRRRDVEPSWRSCSASGQQVAVVVHEQDPW